MRFLVSHLRGATAQQLLKGIAAFGVAELSVRIVRLITVVIMARRMSPEILGSAALALTIFEFTRVLANVGVGQQIITAKASQLESICKTAHRIFWIWCGGVATFQVCVAIVLGLYFGQVKSAQMLCSLALVYPFMPSGLVQCFLLMREGRAAQTARTGAIQTIADHVLTASMLLVWVSPWSIVLPKLLTAPLWLVLTRRARPWHPDDDAEELPISVLLRPGISILAMEMMLALRNHADKLIISATLGVTALGTYYFAFNAGIGLLSSVITAFGTVSFPLLSSAKKGARQTHIVRLLLVAVVAIIVPIAILQSLLASFYVPFVFGAKWAHAASLVGILCLAGIPQAVSALTTNWLRVSGSPDRDFYATATGSIVALSGIAVGAHFGGLHMAATLLVVGLSIISIPFAIANLKFALRMPNFSSSKVVIA